MNSGTQSSPTARALLAVALFCSSPFWSGSAGARQSAANTAGEATEYPPVYRVEAIVFRHAQGRSDRRRANGPADFTARLDPLLVADANQSARRQLAALARFLPVAEVPGTPDETTPFLESEEETLRPIPPVYSALGDLSAPLQRAMSRLIDAPEYEPVVARAWIQLAEPGQATTAVRVHDQRVVEIAEPVSDRNPVPVARVLPFDALAEPQPPALAIYRLDGTLRLRSRQFLHLDLDLVWQSPARAVPERNVAPGPGASPGLGRDSRAGDEPRGAEAADSGERAEAEWELHRLQQSRVVRPGRLEYFDSALFGVLVYIERFEQVVPVIEEEAPKPESGTPDPATNADGSGRPVTDPGG